MRKIRKFLLASMVLLPITAICMGASLYLEAFRDQPTPITSWVAILLLVIYSMVKIDIKKLMEMRNGTREDSE